MEKPSNKAMRGRWRRRLFWAWVAASALVALYIGIADPFANYLDERRAGVALVVPALLFFMLATGLGWLVMLVTSKRK